MAIKTISSAVLFMLLNETLRAVYGVDNRRSYGDNPLEGYEINVFGNRPSIPFLDETPQVYPTYLPPVPIYPPTPIQPISNDEILFPPYHYLPPTSNSFNNIDVKILNMSCIDSQHHRFFQSSFKTTPASNIPIIDNAKENCIFVNGDTFNINIEGDKMTQCGVRYCMDPKGVNLCLPLRIPIIRGLKLPEDSLVTLQCKPQERTASQTKHFRMNSFNIQGRNSGAIAAGGLQRNFETDINLYRKGQGNEFSQIVTPGSNVQFGEDLLLKAAVREGDGWKYSHMGMVIMQRISSSNPTTIRNNQDAVIMVDSQGCRIPTMKTICPEHPQQINPLITTFPFRAFMFQGARNGDEMVLSVKLTGCLQYEDCLQVKNCEEKLQGRTRAKRDFPLREKTGNSTSDWQSYLEFRVVYPEEKMSNQYGNLFLLLGGFGAIFGILMLSITLRRKKEQL